jgi:hypothetical protein
LARKDAHPGKAEAAAERRLKALQLRMAGVPYRSIAAQLDVSLAQAHEDVQRELEVLAEKSQAEAAHVRTLELERLDAMTMALWQQARQGNQGAVDRVLRVMERRSRLLGLDAPEKQERSGEITIRIVEEEADVND